MMILPARFDWSIMGCTILLLALMNLGKDKTEGKNRDFKSPTIKGDKYSLQSTIKTKPFA